MEAVPDTMEEGLLSDDEGEGGNEKDTEKKKKKKKKLKKKKKVILPLTKNMKYYTIHNYTTILILQYM